MELKIYAWKESLQEAWFYIKGQIPEEDGNLQIL